jgi:hypothetical protein
LDREILDRRARLQRGAAAVGAIGAPLSATDPSVNLV